MTGAMGQEKWGIPKGSCNHTQRSLSVGRDPSNLGPSCQHAQEASFLQLPLLL